MSVLAVGLGVLLLLVAVTDFRSQTIPDGLTMAVAVLGFVWTVQHSDLSNGFVQLGLAGVTCAVFWGLGEIYWRRKGHEALGIGDAKLIGAGVMCCGISSLWAILLLASIGGILATLLARWWRGTPESGVPFGPYLALAIYLVFLMGDDWIIL